MARARTAKHPKPEEIEPEDVSQEAPDEEPVFPVEPAGFAPASKTEAVRIALSEGLDSLEDIRDFVRAKFGHDMTKAHISSYKSRLGSREAAKAAPEPEPVIEPTTPGKSMNKSEAARAAIDAGYDKPAEAVEYIRSTFGIEIAPTHFSAIKSQYLKAQGAGKTKGKPGRKPREASPAVAVESRVSPAPAKKVIGGDADLFESLKALKPLVANLGVEKVKALAELLG